MKIQLLYSLGCPEWGSALERLKRILIEMSITQTIIITRITNNEDAIRAHAHGTPSILINNKDIEKGAWNRPYTHSCRFYINGKILSRIPSKEMIIDSVNEALSYEGRKKTHKLFALTGGIATGKSTVLSIFKKLGAHVIDADELSHKVLKKNSATYRKVLDGFGDSVLNENGAIDRKKLGNIVWKDDNKRQILEYIIHPEVIKLGEKAISEILKNDPAATIVYEIPILYEGSYQQRFKKVILAYTDPDIQINRLASRNRISEDDAKLLISKQMPIRNKLELADYIIDNSGTPVQTEKQVKQIWNTIKDTNAIPGS